MSTFRRMLRHPCMTQKEGKPAKGNKRNKINIWKGLHNSGENFEPTRRTKGFITVGPLLEGPSKFGGEVEKKPDLHQGVISQK